MSLDVPRLDGALCAETDPELFFPEKGGSTKPAKKLCGSCPAATACLEFALTTGERFGIWGGQSERNRRVTARDRGINQRPLLTPDEVAERRAHVANYDAQGLTPTDIAVRLRTPAHTIANDLKLIRATTALDLPDTA